MRSRGCASSAAAACSGFSPSRRSRRPTAAGEAQTIVENCGNTLILRCAGSEHGGTSQFASRLIGEREVLRTSVSRSQRPFELLPSITRSEHLGIEAAVMDSEIEQLPDLAGYLKFASRREWLRVALTRPAPERTVERGGPRNAGVQRRARPCRSRIAATRDLEWSETRWTTPP